MSAKIEYCISLQHDALSMIKFSGRKQRRGSLGDLLESPRLKKANKQLAKSTTALNMMKDENEDKPFQLRGQEQKQKCVVNNNTLYQTSLYNNLIVADVKKWQIFEIN